MSGIAVGDTIDRRFGLQWDRESTSVRFYDTMQAADALIDRGCAPLQIQRSSSVLILYTIIVVGVDLDVASLTRGKYEFGDRHANIKSTKIS